MARLPILLPAACAHRNTQETRTEPRVNKLRSEWCHASCRPCGGGL